MADVVLQPNRGIQVQVVGGLVQQQDLRVHQDQTGQVDPGFLSPGEIGKVFVPEGPLNAQTGADFLQPGLDLIQYFFRISFHRMEMTVAGEDL